MTTATIDLKKLTPQQLRVVKAKTALILEHPFVGTVALNMPTTISTDVPTAATNGKRVIYNPEFLDTLDDDEVKFLVAHECMHPMMEHIFRRGDRNPRKWNRACDYVINKLLTDEKIGRMPKVGLLSDDIYQAGGGTSEGIYTILEDNDEGDEWVPGTEGESLDNCEDADNGDAAEQEAEWKVKVAQAAQAAKMMGKLSAGMQRLVDEILTPKVDWREVLQRFLVRCKDDARTFARPNRRFLSQGMYLPSVTGEMMGEVAFAIDCSGSIDQHTVNQFASEIRKVKDDLRPSRIHVLYFDSRVSHVESYGQQDELDIKPHGGGGTDFAPVFERIVADGIEPVAVVFLTDLCCDSFGTAPDCPVLWVSTMEGQAPFGEVVVM